MHLLNKLMHPPQSFVKPRRTFIDALRERPGYKVLSTLLVDTGVDEYLRRPIPLTLFAPTDEAFGKVPQLADLLKDEKRLRSMLYRHICAGRFDLRALGKIARLRDSDGTTHQNRAHVSLIQNARIVEADIRSWNGYLHGIDHVLLKENCAWSMQSCVTLHVSPYAEPPQSSDRLTQTQLLERRLLRNFPS